MMADDDDIIAAAIILFLRAATDMPLLPALSPFRFTPAAGVSPPLIFAIGCCCIDS